VGLSRAGAAQEGKMVNSSEEADEIERLKGFVQKVAESKWNVPLQEAWRTFGSLIHEARGLLKKGEKQ
jgi:hypothetical protein